MNPHKDKAADLLRSLCKLEKEFNEKVDRLLHKSLPFHFGKGGFRVRGTNIYSQWLVDTLTQLIERGEVDQKSLDTLKVNGRPIRIKKYSPKRKRSQYE